MKIKLLDEIKNDLLIDESNLNKKLYLIPLLHSKYLKMYFEYKLKLNKKQKELNQLYKKKYYFYKDGDRLLENQKEIQFNILADEDYSNLNLQVQNLSDLVDILDRTIKKVNNLSFDIKNLISYLTYINGV